MNELWVILLIVSALFVFFVLIAFVCYMERGYRDDEKRFHDIIKELLKERRDKGE